MKSTEQTSTTEVHSYYYPDGLVPVTPQARRFGYPMETYVTPLVWRTACVWSEGRGTNTDKRLYELLEACFVGLGKALAIDDDMLSFTFKHWYREKKRPKAKKKSKLKLGARLLLHPETEEPWLLIFDPEFDFTDQLKRGENPNDRDEEGPGPDPGVELQPPQDI